MDRYPTIKFIATGSAPAALRLKSRKSGADTFSEFMLPLFHNLPALLQGRPQYHFQPGR